MILKGISGGSSTPSTGIGAFVAYATFDRLSAMDFKDGSHFSNLPPSGFKRTTTSVLPWTRRLEKLRTSLRSMPTYINQLSGELNLYQEAKQRGTFSCELIISSTPVEFAGKDIICTFLCETQGKLV